MLLQQAPSTAGHPLSGTAAEWLWVVPLLPLAGFAINGALSIVAAYHAGPSDPAAEHGDHTSVEHSPDEHGAPGDDHHAIARHRFAGITSIVGPGVLLLAFAL